jgi:hypothetical protein
VGSARIRAIDSLVGTRFSHIGNPVAPLGASCSRLHGRLARRVLTVQRVFILLGGAQ